MKQYTEKGSYFLVAKTKKSPFPFLLCRALHTLSLDASLKIQATPLIEYSQGGLQTKGCLW